MTRLSVVLSLALCVSIVVAHKQMNYRQASDVKVLDDSETLRYIEERRLMGIAEIERLDRLQLSAKERLNRELKQEQADYQLLRRLQEDAPEEVLFDDAEVVGEPVLEAMTAKKNRKKNQQTAEGEYYPEGAYDQSYGQYPYGNNGGNYGGNYGGNNRYPSSGNQRYPPSGNSGWGNNNGGWNNNDGGYGGSRSRVCCQECRGGDIQCLSDCDRICKKSQTCNKAGEGAYAAFCMQACPNSITGYSAGDQYLPIKACEGECSAQVQELCGAHSCRDYGCVARNCQEKAPLMCRMT